MEGTPYTTKEAVLKRAQEIIGIPLGQIDTTGRLSQGKGGIGTTIEESWFGYKVNSESEPDFPEAGVELKVAPYVRKAAGITAKERLICNIIDYMTEYDKTFETSSFWHKCETILLMSYEHKYDVPKSVYSIEKAILFSFPTTDLIIIKQDWEKIITKIRQGNAHLITEGDTLYLAACTKGATAATSLRKQPFNTILAKQRAYSLKNSYMTHILRAYVFGTEQDEHIIKDWHELSETTFEAYIYNKVSPYFGLSTIELRKIFGIHGVLKNENEVLLARILGIKGRIANTEEFQSANIIPKTIRISRNGHIRESMSFPTFKFTEIINETWEDSELRRYLEPAKFLFVIFKQSESGLFYFERIKFWNIPYEDLEEVHSVWERTVQVIKDGVKLTFDGRVTHNNFPKSSENRVSHVRPHARDMSDTYPLPDGRQMPKQCFWFNRKYVESIING